jgi:hypothetical protein
MVLNQAETRTQTEVVMTTLTTLSLTQRVAHDPSENNSYQEVKQGAQV